jgi:ABC-type oligopeptide transport system substrate-binding subunit
MKLKKLLALLACGCLILSLVACGGSSSSSGTDTSSDTSSDDSSDDSTVDISATGLLNDTGQDQFLYYDTGEPLAKVPGS